MAFNGHLVQKGGEFSSENVFLNGNENFQKGGRGMLPNILIFLEVYFS